MADGGDELVSYTFSTATVTDIGPTDVPDSSAFDIEAIAFQPGTNILFAANGGTLGTLNQATGSFTAVGGPFGSCDTGPTTVPLVDVDGLTFDPTTGYSGAANVQVTTEHAANLEGLYSFDDSATPVTGLRILIRAWRGATTS